MEPVGEPVGEPVREPAREPAREPGDGSATAPGGKPDWLRVRLGSGPRAARVNRLLGGLGLNTVCQEALCPNRGECFDRGTATFLILGDTCTRNCRFCAVTPGIPVPPDPKEPARVAEAVAALGLRHVVVTSVTRDDLPDGGAGQFAETIAALRAVRPCPTIEVLIPDLAGSAAALAVVVAAGPHILNHNLETVPRLYRRVRPGADYRRSLELLSRVRALEPSVITKAGLMLGVGERREEVVAAMRDLRRHDCQILTLGQYLRPSHRHLAVERYVPPAEFEELARSGMAMGFRAVYSGPLVRSSYHADEVLAAAQRGEQP